MNTAVETMDVAIDEQGLLDALEALQPSKQDQQKRAFEKAYPHILKKRSEGVKEGDIIKVLSAQGILKSRNTYTKWIGEMEAKQANVTESSVVRSAMLRSNATRQS